MPAQAQITATSTATRDTTCTGFRFNTLTGQGALNCTANEFTAVTAVKQPAGGVTSCVAGQSITVDIEADLSGTNTLRYDGGLFFGQAGNDPQQTTGQCSVARFPTSSTGTGFVAPTLAGNNAGSYAAGGVEKWLIQGVKVQCGATAAGLLSIPYLITWNQGQVVVVDDKDNRLSPGTKSKCQAATASLQTSSGTPVTVRGWVKVTKQTNPPGATDTFAFTASNPSNLGNVSPASFNLNAGATQEVQIDLAGSSTRQLVITEGALGGWSATPSITCTAADGASSAASFVTVTGRTITANLDNTNFGANCTITNIATPASITTTKTLTSVNGGAPGANVKAGDVLVYTITSTNSGGTAGNVTLTETVPANTNFTGPDGGVWSCAANAPAGTQCTATQSVAKTGGSASATFTVTVKTPVTDGAAITNIVAVTGSTCSSCTVTKTASAPNLTLTKAANNAPWTVGQTSPQPAYTLTVKNVGSAATIGTITVSDVLPNGITASTGTYSGWSCAVSGQTVTCTSAASLAATSGLASIVLPVSVAAAAAPGVTNNAAVGGGGDPFNGGTTPTPGANCTSLDANNPGHCASTTTTVNTSADVAIVKTQATPNPAVPGQGVTWTITVTNNGPNAAAAVATSDVVPAAVSGLSLGGTDAGACSISSQTVICNFGTLANAATKTYTISGTLASSFSGSLDNTATVTTTSSDPTPGNNTSTSNTPTAPKADLVVTKTASPLPSGTYVPGQALNYTITVKNNGPSDANGVSVTDTVPGTVTVSGWTCTASAGADCDTTTAGTGASGSTNAIALNNVNLPSGATITLAISGTAQLSATGDIVNTATATPPGGVSCSTPPCARSSTVTNSNVGVPQLTIGKQATPSTFAVGASGTYSLTVTNTGSASTAGTITVSDPMPSGVTITLPFNVPNWNCATSTSTQLTCTASTVLLPGSSAAVINVPVTIYAGAAPGVTNTAQASGGGDATCSNIPLPARCAKTITTPVNSPQLDVKKQLNGSFVVGQSASYTITVTNNGQSATVAGGTIADTIPTGLTIGAPLPADCSNPSGQQIVCTVPANLATGGSHTYTIPVTPTATVLGNNLANTATASGGGDATCPNAGHCSGQTTDTVTAAQLKLTKSASPATFVVNQAATYTLKVQNTGTAATTAATTIADAIPSGLTIGTLPLGCALNPAGSQTVQCTVASGFAANATQSFDIPVTPQVGVIGQSVINTAGVTGGGDPGCASGTALDQLPARCVGQTTNPVNAPQLTMTKTASGAFAVGVPASYTLKVRNTGTAATSGDITITDVVPSSLTIGALPGGCAKTGQQVTCTITASLAVNASQSFVITVTPTASASPSVSNTATAQGGGDPICPTTDNCKSTIVTTVDAPSLQLSKDSNGAWTVGQGGATYTLKVKNASATTATVGTITVQDAMPNGITPNWTDPLTTNASWSCTHAGQSVSCTSVAGFSLAANGNDTITLSVNVSAAAVASGNSAQVTNNASVGGGGDPNNGGNPPTPGSCTAGDAHCANTTTTVNTAATINVVKTLDAATSTPIVAGQTVTYLFTATNSGASAVANYTISDVVPAHTTFAAAGNGSTTATSSCSGGAAAGTLCSITFASVPANGAATVKASFVVDSPIPDGTLFIANVMSQPDSCTAAGCTPPPLPSGCSDAGCTPPTACAAADPHCVRTPVAIADMQASASASVNATVGTPVSITTTCSDAGPNAAAAPTCSVTGAPAGASTTCTYNGGVIPNPLPVGGAISCLTTLTPTSAVVITLITTADSSTPDSNTNNNSATTVVNVGQVTPQPDSTTTPINTPVSIDVVANDGVIGTRIDPSSVSVPASGPGTPAHGNVGCNGAGVCTYTPNTDYSGTDTFNYTVCDTAKPPRCGTTTVSVAVGPKANDDGASTPINTPLASSVTGNDHYPPNSTFTATSTPGHGTLTMNVDGSYTYTPAANYSGADSFTYKVCEPAPNQNLCSTATVTVTIAAGISDMMASGAPTQTMPVNTPVTVLTKCTNNGPQVAVNATCTVTGPVQSAAASAVAGGAAVAPGTVCTPAMPVAALAVGGVITCTTPLTPTQTGSYTFTTTAASDTPDSDSNNNAAPSVVIATATAAVPAQDPPVPAPIDARWMLALMALLLGAGAATAMSARERSIRPRQ